MAKLIWTSRSGAGIPLASVNARNEVTPLIGVAKRLPFGGTSIFGAFDPQFWRQIAER